MDNGEKILRILENSVCLKKDQLTGYLKGTLSPEELHVVELHLASCQLCREAVEGFVEKKGSLPLLNNLALPPLAETATRRQVISNKTKATPPPPSGSSFAAARHHPYIPKSTFSSANEQIVHHGRNLSWIGISAIVIMLILGVFLFWQYDSGSSPMIPLISQNRASLNNSDSFGSIQNITKQTVDTHGMTTDTNVHKAILSTSRNTFDSLATSSVGNSSVNGLMPTKDSTSSRVVSILPKPTNPNTTTQPTVVHNNLTTTEPKKRKPSKTSSAKISQNQPAERVVEKPKSPSSLSLSKDHAKGPVNVQSSDYNTGFQLYRKKQYASAILYLSTAAENEMDPNHWDALYYTALCNLQIGKKGRAKRMLRKVAKAGVSLSKAAKQQLDNL